MDWSAVRRSTYLLDQTFRYEYPAPIRDLDHRLLVIPPERFGDQRRIEHTLEIGLRGARVENRVDRFGNVVVAIFAPRIASSVEFTARVSLERHSDDPHRLQDGWLGDGYLLEPTCLTAPDSRIRQAAEQLAAKAPWGLPLAESINDWVYQAMSYQDGVTGVRTTAPQALAIGRGVCQDYAHLMLSVCRACNLPARYVSGHLIGGGGSHSWVEVVHPIHDRAGAQPAGGPCFLGPALCRPCCRRSVRWLLGLVSVQLR